MSKQSLVDAHIVINPVRGGFIVRYPTFVEGADYAVDVTEVATSIGKAMRIAKAAVEQFSLVKKTAEDAAD